MNRWVSTMIYKLLLYTILASLLFSSIIIILDRNLIELMILYIVWFIAMYMLFSIWFSVKLDISSSLSIVKLPIIKIGFNNDFYMKVVEFSIWSILSNVIMEIFNVPLWQYLLLLILLFIIYRVTSRIPIKRIHRYVALLSLFMVLYLFGYLSPYSFSRLNDYFEFIEGLAYGVE